MSQTLRQTMFEMVRHPIETARTAPLGTGIVAAAAAAAVDTPSIIDTINQPSISRVFAVGLVLASGIVSGAPLVRRQLEIRERLERHLANAGFEERYFVNLTGEWCNRQTTLTALRKTEFQNEFAALCKRERDDSMLTWLPHF